LTNDDRVATARFLCRGGSQGVAQTSGFDVCVRASGRTHRQERDVCATPA